MHYQPAPDVPLAIGGYFGYEDYTVGANEYGLTDLRGWSTGPEVRGWYDLGFVAPYAKAAFETMSQHQDPDSENGAVSGVVIDRGLELAVGVEARIVENLAALIEHRRSSGGGSSRAWLLGVSARL